jgi:hypothetical protein
MRIRDQIRREIELRRQEMEKLEKTIGTNRTVVPWPVFLLVIFLVIAGFVVLAVVTR